MTIRRVLDYKTKNLLKSLSNNTCAVCGKVTDHTEIDHIKPLWDGGTDEIENLQVLCYKCHQKKSAEEYSQYSKLHPVIVIKDGVVISKQEG